MDIQKEREAFEDQITRDGFVEFSGYSFQKDECDEYIDERVECAWFAYKQAFSRAMEQSQNVAVPEGFVLVQKLLSDELADALASDAFNNIQSMFDYEHRDSPALQREQFRLRWCKNKARELQENYKMLIEAQEQGHD
ncbi:hypothetical protein [Acinetobacter chengduensis]|uniref:DUF4376 domain-containing protein n=1 Tax=Acinetobacter chengduensis TaxID=2420890 RepID=A0ABX9TSW8_9GAMM|nr:hypothetical protein [Acinetobacter chengduensis]RLL18390.1 hypothetical protein D9K81_15310 [Acinetobacter chengduensis]